MLLIFLYSEKKQSFILSTSSNDVTDFVFSFLTKTTIIYCYNITQIRSNLEKHPFLQYNTF